MIEANSDLEKYDFAGDMATQHTPFIPGETSYWLVAYIPARPNISPESQLELHAIYLPQLAK
jgi:hypothetical protein